MNISQFYLISLKNFFIFFELLIYLSLQPPTPISDYYYTTVYPMYLNFSFFYPFEILSFSTNKTLFNSIFYLMILLTIMQGVNCLYKYPEGLSYPRQMVEYSLSSATYQLETMRNKLLTPHFSGKIDLILFFFTLENKCKKHKTKHLKVYTSKFTEYYLK